MQEYSRYATVTMTQLNTKVNVNRLGLPVIADAFDGGRIVWMSLSKLPMRESYREHNKPSVTKCC